MAKKNFPPPVKPVDQEATDRLMELVKAGFDHRVGVEQKDRIEGAGQPPAGPAPSIAPVVSPSISIPTQKELPVVVRDIVLVSNTEQHVGTPRRHAKPIAKRQDPDYMPTSTYLLRHLVQRGKIAAARAGVDFADVVNAALYDWLETFEAGLEGREE